MQFTRAQRLTRPDISYGPFRFFEAVPWLLMALACRVTAAGGTWLIWPLMAIEYVAVLMAFIAVARRAFELVDQPSPLEGMSLAEEFRLSLRILWRVVVVLIAAAVFAACLRQLEAIPYLLLGLDGMAFNQPGLFGRAWAAIVAALVLLMVLGVDCETAKPALRPALRGLIRHGVRFAAMIAVAGAFHIVWGAVQIQLLNVIWSIPVFDGADQRTKNLIYFGVAFCFAFGRLWVTLLLLIHGLRPQNMRAQAASAASSSNRP
jgi:hypothetical protein